MVIRYILSDRLGKKTTWKTPYLSAKSSRLYCSILLALSTILSIPAGNLNAQEQDLDFIDAFDPIDASPAAFHNERFKEAEEALLQGLSRRGDPELSPPPKVGANVHQVSATNRASLKLEDRPQVTEVRAPIKSPVEANPSLDAKPAGLVKSGDNTSKGGLQPQIKLVSKTETEPEMKVDRQVELKKEPRLDRNTAKSAAIVAKPKMVDNEAELRDLRRELADTKSSLAAAELEISRLSAIIQESSRARLSLGDIPTRKVSQPSVKGLEVASTLKQPTSLKLAQEPAPQVVPDPTGDLQVATIAVEKADLRLGPGKNHSALMSLRRGSRLAVEARQGEWYRVFAPNGQRAWILSSLVRFGDGAASLNDGSSVQVRGYDGKLR